MKINDSFKSKAGLGIDKASAEKTGAGKKSDKMQAETKSADNVTLSPMSAQLQSLEAKIASDKAFDVEKVAAIKLAISSGQFKVSSEKVADGLIETVKDLLTIKKT
jgi:negative regulator of flagellin synthesis FlgM